MQIGIAGQTDKRPLVYALFKLLQNAGNVVFITDERHYLRLTENHVSGEEFQNVMIIVTDSTPDEVQQEIGYNFKTDFDYVIYDIKDYLPPNVKFYYLVTSLENDASLTLDYPAILDNYKEVKFLYGDKPKKGVDNIPVDAKLFQFCERVEAHKVIPLIPTKILEIIARDFAEELETTPQNLRRALERVKSDSK